MYRLLAAKHGEVRERRDQLTHPPYARPELLASEPNQVWSWDITKLLGPATWTYFYLFVILDIYSRYVVGWTVQHQETALLAERLIAETLAKQQIPRDQLTIHADRGSAMRSKPVAFLLSDLGVTKTHSRPYTSTDNPYSEAHFKTLKYRPGFPARFTSILEARAFCRAFLPVVQRSASPLRDRAHDTRRPSTTASPSKPTPPAQSSSTPPTPRPRTGSSAGHHDHPRYRPARGSTNPPTQGGRSLNSQPNCLTELDRLRALARRWRRCSSHSAHALASARGYSTSFRRCTPPRPWLYASGSVRVMAASSPYAWSKCALVAIGRGASNSSSASCATLPAARKSSPPKHGACQVD